MGIHSTITIPEAGGIVWDGAERRGRRSGERFPWEQASPGEVLRGRLLGLIAGVILTGLVGIANAEPISRLEGEVRQLAGLADGQRAEAAEPDEGRPRRTIAAAATPSPDRSARSALRMPAPAVSAPRVQLGSYLSMGAANRASAMIGESYRSLLGGRELHISQALVQEKRFYRVAVHMVTDAEAYALCDTIKSDRKDCFVWPGNAASAA